MPDGSTTVLVQGIERVRIVELIDTEPYLRVRGVPLYEDERHDMATEALMRAVLALFEKVVELNPNLPEDAYVAAMNEKEPGGLADLLAHVLDLETSKRQELLETLDANDRLQKLSIILGQELDVLELEDRIQTQVQQEVDKTQREYFLREQMRAIQTELGEGDDDAAARSASCKEKLTKPACPRRCAPRPRRRSPSWPPCPPCRRRRPSSATTWTGCWICPGRPRPKTTWTSPAPAASWKATTTACPRSRSASWSTSPCASWPPRR